jgi:Ca2+-binding EF-hand superfamily protein
MSTFLAFVSLMTSVYVSADSEALFQRLDQNKDGLIRSDEISVSARGFFQRALRVADGNEDGALTREELARAISDPRPATVPVPRIAGAPGNVDPRTMDRNGDGVISLDEVPAPLKSRFEQWLRQTDRTEIPTASLQDFLRGMQIRQALVVPGSEKQADASEVMSSASEKTWPAQRPDQEKQRGLIMEQRKNPVERADKNDSAVIFSRLDRNGDGRLTMQELPERMRQNLQAMDQDGDQAVNRRELAAAMLRRLQSPPPQKQTAGAKP